MYSSRSPLPAITFIAISYFLDDLKVFLSFFHQINLHAHRSLQLFQSPVLFGHVLHLISQRRFHSTKFRTPFLKLALLIPYSWHRPETGTPLPTFFKSPITFSTWYRAVFILNLIKYLGEKIGLLNTRISRGLQKKYPLAGDNPHI